MPITKLFQKLTSSALKKRSKINMPAFVSPMLATLTTDYFSDPNWIYEHKFDGERCLAFKKNGKVTLKTRNKNIINNKYPELVQDLAKQTADNFVVDGEIVALNPKGVSDFQLLQGRINLKKGPKISQAVASTQIYYNIFDIMYANGYDLRDVDLLDRKQILKNLLKFGNLLKYTDHKVGDGIKFFKQACRLKWEGLIAKDAHSAYTGKRSKAWLKFKCIMQEELIIVGYTEPQGTRTDFGALLVGYYKGKNLIFAGKVGTGYSQEVLKTLGAKLRRLEIKRCPLSNYTENVNSVHWVSPKLVAEFRFAEWTKSGRLRAPRYKGLRDDKSAKEVVREG